MFCAQLSFIFLLRLRRWRLQQKQQKQQERHVTLRPWWRERPNPLNNELEFAQKLQKKKFSYELPQKNNESEEGKINWCRCVEAGNKKDICTGGGRTTSGNREMESPVDTCEGGGRKNKTINPLPSTKKAERGGEGKEVKNADKNKSCFGTGPRDSLKFLGE